MIRLKRDGLDKNILHFKLFISSDLIEIGSQFNFF